MEKWKIGMTREAYGRILERRHVAIKKMMKEVAKELPVGSQNGLLYGELVEGLEERLTDFEAQLRQEERKAEIKECRLAALSAEDTTQGGTAEVLHTHTISLSDVRKNLGEWRRHFYKSIAVLLRSRRR